MERTAADGGLSVQSRARLRRLRYVPTNSAPAGLEPASLELTARRSALELRGTESGARCSLGNRGRVDVSYLLLTRLS
jgi:hypothetical protein